MIKAIPVNKSGEQTGEEQTFQHETFERMKRCFKNVRNFPWKVVENTTVSKEKELISTKNAKPKEEVKTKEQTVIN